MTPRQRALHVMESGLLPNVVAVYSSSNARAIPIVPVIVKSTKCRPRYDVGLDGSNFNAPRRKLNWGRLYDYASAWIQKVKQECSPRSGNVVVISGSPTMRALAAVAMGIEDEQRALGIMGDVEQWQCQNIPVVGVDLETRSLFRLPAEDV